MQFENICDFEIYNVYTMRVSFRDIKLNVLQAGCFWSSSWTQVPPKNWKEFHSPQQIHVRKWHLVDLDKKIH